jgi:osmotically-inducible protein OsmY
MITQFRKLLLLTFFFMCTSLCSQVFADADLKKASDNQNVSDARMETKISTTFELSPYLRANDLQVSVRDHKATLTGKVGEDVNKDLAKQIALGVDGITDVDNKIEVIADYTPSSTSEGGNFGQYIEDASITAAVKSKLLWSKHSAGLATEVNTNNGKVNLTGTAATPIAKEFAGRLAMNTSGVKSVSNQLTIAPEKMKVKAMPENNSDIAKTNSNKSEQAIADTWITTKVKSTFMYSRNINSSDISVDTKNGIVSLSGKIENGAERELAIELAENVRGVKSIDANNLK